ncbi:hypothetical protein, partial [Uliginosibacterium gangwonense]|uniref:hypothetical protein n=1 Tax=Uliginosibacterium gangwonense TaxID=392736 RepID=UPI0004766972
MVLTTVLVGALGRGAFNPGGAGEHQVRGAQFGEAAITLASACATSTALDSLVLVFEAFDDFRLVSVFLGLMVFGETPQGVVQVLALVEALGGLSQIGDVGF